MRKTLIKITAIFILLISTFSCSKDENRDLIPYVYVNFTMYPNTIDFIATGQWAYVTGGYKDIIIYRPMEDEFMAFERACPYDPLTENARVNVEPSGLIAVDTVCGSRFLLTDGSPIEGPSKIPLKQYRTSWDGYALQVYN
ncbi:MAG: Rieske (2Fe-2S) protein [Chloroflexota bacterium]|jgi:nitrite reductase/ring-hydroxylating ferredoxin subunit|nr:hypothetical protein [Lentimicrobium sp.]